MENEVVDAPSAEVSAPEPTPALTPMNDAQALAKLNEMDEPAREPETAAAEPAPEAEPEAPATEAAATPETEADDSVDVHGNAFTRLRDGTRVKVGDLKKAYDEAAELRARQSDFDAKRREFEERSAKFVQQTQNLGQSYAIAKKVVERGIPADPTEAYAKGEIDVITYNEIKAKRDLGIQEWQSLNHAEQLLAQQAQERAQAEEREFVDRETQAFRDRVPEAKTDEGLRAFFDEASKIAEKEYGISRRELGGIIDHRHLLIVRDALAYRKGLVEKAAALEKAKGAPPVSAPPPKTAPRRVNPDVGKAELIQNKLSAARSSGRGLSDADALAILNNMD
jgi:hypothetical protein